MSGNELDPPGGLILRQRPGGCRHTEDAFHLIDFFRMSARTRRVADMGSGNGVIAIALAVRFPSLAVHAVEIDPEACGVIAENARQNGVERRITIVNNDYRRMDSSLSGYFDAVVTNPPYRRPGTGKISPDPARAVARHERHGSLEDLVGTASRVLRHGGMFFAVFLSERLTDLVYTMRENNIEPKELTPVYPDRNADSSCFLVSGRKNGGTGIKMHRPLFRRF